MTRFFGAYAVGTDAGRGPFGAKPNVSRLDVHVAWIFRHGCRIDPSSAGDWLGSARHRHGIPLMMATWGSRGGKLGPLLYTSLWESWMVVGHPFVDMGTALVSRRDLSFLQPV